MRHQMKKITLDRTAAARRALLSNLAASLILYEKISTTKAKAKATQELVERLITKAKQKDLNARRALAVVLPVKNAVKKLMEVIGPKYAARRGGYTRITVTGNRKGDNAEEAVIEFV